MNTALIAEALRQLANALETPAATPQPAPPVDNAHVAPGCEPFTPAAPSAAPAKRGRGRPAKGEDAQPAAPVAAPAAVEADPFDTAVPPPPAPTVPTATVDEARAALKALAAATTQAQAVKVMKDSVGVSNLSEPLTGAQCAVLRDAAWKATPVTGKVAPIEQPDPFAGPSSITDPLPVATPKVYTPEEVKAIITKAGTKASQDTLMKIVMKHGGKAKNAETGVEGASLKALPAAAYAAVVTEINALPNTKG